MNKYFNNQEISEETGSINAIKLNCFQRMPIKAHDGSITLTPRWDDKDICHGQVIDTIRHYNKSLTKKTTTNTGRNKKFSRKVREESVEAI